jgi:glycosyltransferase involved in cell wall biosynthesis
VDIPSLEHGSKLERIIRKIDRRYRYFIYKRSDGLIAISSCVENFINRNKNMPSIIIPPLKDTELFEKPVCNKNNSIRFIYAGCPFPIDGRVVDEIAYKDRLDLVIDVIGSLLSEKYNLKFDIYGITKAQYTKVVKRQDELLETYANQIKFYGRIPYESCTKKVSEADFLVLIREDTLMSRAGVSTKIVDSITGGTPVITTVFGDIGNYITEGRNGYCINSTQIKSIYNEMKKVCNLPREQIETMKMECYESRIFDYRKYVQELRLFLEKI